MDLNLIKPDEELATVLKDAKEPNHPYRLIMVSIDHKKCKLLLEKKLEPKSNQWQKDYEELLKKLDRSSTSPFFLLVHINSQDLQWVLIHMSPPNANVREKMAAASSKATLKNFFGSILINQDVFVEDWDDLSVEKIEDMINPERRRRGVQTVQELEHQKQQEMEVMHKIEHCNHSRGGGALHFNCLLDVDAKKELEKFKQGIFAIIRFQMSVDLSKVIFGGKVTAEDCPKLARIYEYEKHHQDLGSLLPNHLEPGYILFRFKHISPEQQIEQRIIMACYVPVDCQLPMKMRFAYSVNQLSFVEKMKDFFDKIVTHIEVDNLDEVNVERLFVHLYPKWEVIEKKEQDLYDKANENPLKFDKPLPRGRGPRRMIK